MILNRINIRDYVDDIVAKKLTLEKRYKQLSEIREYAKNQFKKFYVAGQFDEEAIKKRKNKYIKTERSRN